MSVPRIRYSNPSAIESMADDLFSEGIFGYDNASADYADPWSDILPFVPLPLSQSLSPPHIPDLAVVDLTNGSEHLSADIPIYALNRDVADATENAQNAQPLSKTPKYACLHQGCSGSFTRANDLKRHELVHETSPYFLWGCGCCLNANDPDYSYSSERKDHVVQHVQKSHGVQKKSRELFSCSSCSGSNGITFIFSFESCLKTHQAAKHGPVHKDSALASNSMLSSYYGLGHLLRIEMLLLTLRS